MMKFWEGFEKQALTHASTGKDLKDLTPKERDKAISAITAASASLGAGGYGGYKAYKALPETLKAPVRSGAKGYMIGGLGGSILGSLAAHTLLPKDKEKKNS